MGVCEARKVNRGMLATVSQWLRLLSRHRLVVARGVSHRRRIAALVARQQTTWQALIIHAAQASRTDWRRATQGTQRKLISSNWARCGAGSSLESDMAARGDRDKHVVNLGRMEAKRLGECPSTASITHETPAFRPPTGKTNNGDSLLLHTGMVI